MSSDIAMKYADKISEECYFAGEWKEISVIIDAAIAEATAPLHLCETFAAVWLWDNFGNVTFPDAPDAEVIRLARHLKMCRDNPDGTVTIEPRGK